MSNARLIFGIVMAIFFIICLTISVPNYLQNLEDVKTLEKELEKGEAEYAEMQDDLQTMVDEVADKQ